MSLPLEPANYALQELARFGHDETESIDMGEDLEQLVTIEMLNGFSQLAAFLQRANKIRPGLCSASGQGIFLGIFHGRVLQN